MSKSKRPLAFLPARPAARGVVSPSALQRWNGALASDVAGDAPTVLILDAIGNDGWSEGVTAKSVQDQLRAIGDRDVCVLINSPGGNFFEGLAIYNMLIEHKGAVTVKIVGIAASAASVIAMAGDQIEIAPSGFLMIHNTWVSAQGDQHALREVADWLAPFDAVMIDIFAARTGLSRADLCAKLDKETWIGGAQAVELGLADALLDATDLSTSQNHASGARDLHAARQLEILVAQSGGSRSMARSLLNNLKSGKPSAAPTGRPSAVQDPALSGLLSKLKSL